MRKTKVIGFSAPPQIEKKILNYTKKTGKTISELMREMIENYFEQLEQRKSHQTATKAQSLSDRDLNQVLELYYDLMGMSTKEILVVGLGIVQRNHKVMIGRRKAKDKHVKDLSWVFPGGKMTTLDFRANLKKEVKEETGLDVDVKEIIHARLIPDSPDKKVRIVALYFYCEPERADAKAKPGGDLNELKWISPTSVCRYFTTSTTDEVMNFLGRLGR